MAGIFVSDARRATSAPKPRQSERVILKHGIKQYEIAATQAE